MRNLNKILVLLLLLTATVKFFLISCNETKTTNNEVIKDGCDQPCYSSQQGITFDFLTSQPSLTVT
jgi:hypothetical protein